MAQSPTYRYLTNSLSDFFKQAKADNTISQGQITMWIKMAINVIKKNEFDKYTLQIMGSNRVIFTDIALSLQYTNAGNVLKNRKHFTLPAPIFDLFNESGIDWIDFDPPANLDCGITTFEPITMNEIQMLSSFEKMNRYFVRIDQEVYLIGIEDIPVTTVNVCLIAAEEPNLTNTQWDAPIQLDGEEMAAVYNQVINWGLTAMRIPDNRTETGADKTKVPAYKALTQQQEQPQQ